MTVDVQETTASALGAAVITTFFLTVVSAFTLAWLVFGFGVYAVPTPESRYEAVLTAATAVFVVSFAGLITIGVAAIIVMSRRRA